MTRKQLSKKLPVVALKLLVVACLFSGAWGTSRSGMTATGVAATVAPWGIPIKYEILTAPTGTSYGITHDGSPLYIGSGITYPEAGDPGINAFTAVGSTFRTYVGVGLGTTRYNVIDFSDRLDSATSLCEETTAKVGPIANYAYYDGAGHCVVQWPTAQTYAFFLNVGAMFKEPQGVGQSVTRDAVSELSPQEGGRYRLAWDQPVLVTKISSDGTRTADTRGQDAAALWYWDGSRNKAKVVARFNVPLTFKAVTCPDGICPW